MAVWDSCPVVAVFSFLFLIHVCLLENFFFSRPIYPLSFLQVLLRPVQIGLFQSKATVHPLQLEERIRIQIQGWVYSRSDLVVSSSNAQYDIDIFSAHFLNLVIDLCIGIAIEAAVNILVVINDHGLEEDGRTSRCSSYLRDRDIMCRMELPVVCLSLAMEVVVCSEEIWNLRMYSVPVKPFTKLEH